jgi:multidrug efflux pump subunit AcrB
MSKPHEQHGQPGAEPSGNVFVRFQQGFERGFNQFREGYGALLEQVIARRSAFVTISLAIAVGSLSLFFFLGRDYFPEIRSGSLRCICGRRSTRIRCQDALPLVSSSISCCPGGRKRRQ